MDNRRKHMRLQISVDAEMKTSDNKIIKGTTKNISFSGVMIEFQEEPKIEPGEKCKISLIIQQNSNMEINFDCRVVHRTNSSLGFEFICLNGLDGYENFKNLLVYNSPNPQELMEELEKNPGIEHSHECLD